VKRRSRTTQLLRELAEERFHGCDECSKDAYDSADAILKPLRLSRREALRLNRNLMCPGCEASLTLSDYVAAYSDEELRHNRRFKRWHEEYSSKVNAFEGFSFEIQRTITKALKRSHITVLEPGTWYRGLGRKPRSPEDCFPFNRQSPGRFNHFGQLAFYLGAEKLTAALEVIQNRPPKKKHSPLWLAEVTVESKLRVLDVRQPFPDGRQRQKAAFLQGLIESSFLRRPKTGDKPMHPEYLLTQVLADAARWHELDGIIYTSSQEYPYSYRVFGTNLVIFRQDYRDSVKIGTQARSALADDSDTLGLPRILLKDSAS
jgi:hypothetical protein